MILADTSAWVEFLRATGSAVDRRLTSLIEHEEPLAVTDPVVMEVLAGARDERHAQDLRAMLFRHELLAFDPASDFDGATRLYRRCRDAGVTPGAMIDCMIAAVALRAEANLLAADKDFGRIAAVVGIELDLA